MGGEVVVNLKDNVKERREEHLFVEQMSFGAEFRILNRTRTIVTILLQASAQLLFFIFIHNKGIHIHMTYNNNDNKQSEIITLSLCL